MVKHTFVDANTIGIFTNHNLQATGATTFFDANISEGNIQKRSGHLSTKVVRMYERNTPTRDLAISNLDVHCYNLNLYHELYFKIIV